MIATFQMPKKLIMENDDPFHGKFSSKPFEKGLGTTIFNALRRVLISSLEGYAITSIRIPGVVHEFATIPGVVEDVAEIILNLKQVRFKKKENFKEPEPRILVPVKNQVVLQAKHLAEASASFEILNPELVICHLEKSANFDLELGIEKGRGYLPAEENKPENQVFGLIPIDAVFSPILNVRFSIENTRVEQKTDYEKANLEIHTDGSISAEAALQEAITILIKHFMLLSGKEELPIVVTPKEVDVVDEAYMRMRNTLKTPVDIIPMSVRLRNCLKSVDHIKYLWQVVRYKRNDLMRIKNLGTASLEELEKILAEKNLYLEMDISQYKLE